MTKHCPITWNWKYNKKIISHKVIMEIVDDSWKDCFIADEEKSCCQIRVTFKSN